VRSRPAALLNGLSGASYTYEYTLDLLGSWHAALQNNIVAYQNTDLAQTYEPSALSQRNLFCMAVRPMCRLFVLLAAAGGRILAFADQG
jgi:hypothetical protein